MVKIVKAVAVFASKRVALAKPAPTAKVAVKKLSSKKASPAAGAKSAPKAAKPAAKAAPLAAAQVMGAAPISIPFETEAGKYVFPFECDMYGLYDRMGEGVMYGGRWVFDPAFFGSAAKAWDTTLVSVELVGFSASTCAYLKSYGASAKAWESRLLGFWKDDPESFLGECLFEQLDAAQVAVVDVGAHGSSVADGSCLAPLGKILRAASKSRPHK